MRRAAALLAALLLAGCTADFTPEDEALALRVANDPSFYQSGRGTPAEFMTNKCEYDGITCRTVRNGPGDDYVYCAAKLAGIYRDAQLGFAWTEPQPRWNLPELAAAPRIDGLVSAAEWSGARLCSGEFPLSETIRREHAPSRWYFGVRNGTFYAAAVFADREITVFRDRAQGTPEPLYLADCFELFLRPDLRSREYYEILVNPEGAFWCMRQKFRETGSWDTLDADCNPGITAAARRIPGGWSVEAAVSLTAVKAGAEFSFVAVRIDSDGGELRRSAPVPILYDGHNVFGHIVATSSTATTPAEASR